MPKVPVREFAYSHWRLLLRTPQNYQQTLTMADDKIRFNSSFRVATHITSLKSGKSLSPYDDLNCLEDLCRVGLLKQMLTVPWPYAYTLTERGQATARQLIDYVEAKGTFEAFLPLNLKAIKEVKKSVHNTLRDIGPS